MKLFLTSSGIERGIQADFLKLLGQDPRGLKVAFIPTAADVETNRSYVAADREKIRALGLEIVEVDLKESDEATLRQKFSQVEVVYVSGGNTFYLLDWARRSGFANALKDFLKNDGIYVGASAGSYIACPTIEMANWKGRDRNFPGLKDWRSLNLVSFLISAHFEPKHRAAVEAGSQTINLPVVALRDGQAVLVNGEEVKVVGPGRKTFFNGFKEAVTH